MGITLVVVFLRLSENDRTFGKTVGYCPQEGGLDDYLTSEEMLWFHARLRGFSKEQAQVVTIHKS